MAPRVKLIAHTKIEEDIPNYVLLEDSVTDLDDIAEQAGRLCYLSWKRPNPATAGNQGYLENILFQTHFSVMEHGSASFYIDGVTRACLLEFERHRHFSYSVVSQRYVDSSEFAFVGHAELENLSDETKARIAKHAEDALKLYQDLVEELGTKVSRKTARGAARMVLPEGTETRFLVSGNIRAWREMLWKRLSPAADSEIRQVAQLLLGHLKEIAPNSFQDFDEKLV